LRCGSNVAAIVTGPYGHKAATCGAKISAEQSNPGTRTIGIMALLAAALRSSVARLPLPGGALSRDLDQLEFLRLIRDDDRCVLAAEPECVDLHGVQIHNARFPDDEIEVGGRVEFRRS
jgi:hypothetical protein